MEKSKHFINCPETSVWDSLLGFASSHDNIQAIPQIDVLVRSDYRKNIIEKGKVALLSGAGSGHEPMNAGYVGFGGLTGYVAGQIFSSPATHQILKAIRLLGSEPKSAGVLICIMNYTGDRLNFGLACERAKLEGIKVDMFTFSDDVAFYGKGINVGRRGLSGVVMFNKIMGALAEQGLPIEKLKKEAVEINSRIGTMAVCLRSCNVPGVGTTFELEDDEIEIGLGLHGEPGISKTKLLTSRDAVELMINHLTGDRSPLKEILQKSSDDEKIPIAIVLNNLGGVSNFEFNILLKDCLELLTDRCFKVERIFSGTYCTSFSMPGVSLSLMKVTDHYLTLLDSPVDVPVWPLNTVSLHANPSPILHLADLYVERTINYETEDKYPFDRDTFLMAVRSACDAIIKSEMHLNDLDKECGDGDCGSTLRKGATAIQKTIDDDKFVGSFLQMANLCDRHMGGTSGPIYSFFFTGVATVLRSSKPFSNKIIVCHDALKNGMKTISTYSLAQPGDRTMLDTLDAVCQCLHANENETDFGKVAQRVIVAVEEAAQRTTTMKAKAGRAAYVNQSHLSKPDPGATAVAIWMKAVASLFL